MKRTDFAGLGLMALAVTVMAASPALAHTDGHMQGGFLSGFLHPILGWDHVVAMVAVGLWGAFLRAPAIWLLPIVFPLVMAIGAVAGIAGASLPFVEAAIALSGVVLGLMVLFRVKAGLAVAGALVGFFAIFHGFAHGTELPANASAYSYIIGFVIGTGLLHLSGIALGLLTRWPAGVVLVRSLGALISGVGAMFLLQLA